MVLQRTAPVWPTDVSLFARGLAGQAMLHFRAPLPALARVARVFDVLGKARRFGMRRMKPLLSQC